MTPLLEPVDALPRPRGRPRHSKVMVGALVVTTMVSASVIGTQAVRVRAAVARERKALDGARAVELIAQHTIDDVSRQTASALDTKDETLAVDREREKERSQAHIALIRIEKGTAATNQALASTKAIQIQIARYSAQRDACIRGLHRATTALQAGNPSAATAALRAADQPCAAALAAATGARFPYDFPDPSVLTVGSRVYAYSTNSGTGNIQVLVSRDLVQWSIVGDGLAGLPAWAAPGATWAPAVFARGAGFVAYYTAREIASGRQCISVAVSASPAGPFVDSSTAPLVCQAGGSIDPSPFVDESGTAWLLWKSEATITEPPTIWSQPLSTDGLTLAGMPTPMLTPGQKWEGGVVEAPSMIRIAGRDYLFYSGNRWTTAAYAEGAVVCSGPRARAGESSPARCSPPRADWPGPEVAPRSSPRPARCGWRSTPSPRPTSGIPIAGPCTSRRSTSSAASRS